LYCSYDKNCLIRREIGKTIKGRRLQR
jgi:hypothetical protein